ncbi:uncharacterized protein METZ01_LOCUS66332 [marine metagenome]|uniref:Uncharacterized protein n=1 Tax=marine metagenome TaxID=408172 RepID=A0A381TD20_9ZZZZ
MDVFEILADVGRNRVGIAGREGR